MSMDDRQVLARTAWGEARSLGELGMRLTLNTVQNRVKSGVTWWGRTPREVCLKRFQYSCWNTNDVNRPKLLSVTENDPEYKLALDLAQSLLDGTLKDASGGADSYFDRRLTRWPTWSLGRKPVFVLLPHLYFNTIKEA